MKIFINGEYREMTPEEEKEFEEVYSEDTHDLDDNDE